MANEYASTTNQSTSDGLRAKAQETLGRVQDRASEQIETKVTETKTRAADTLNGVAQSLITSSQTMREQGNADASRYIEKAADQVERLAGYLDRADVHEVFDQVEGFARRQPAAFFAGAFAVGFLASRFLKSSRGEIGASRGGFASDTGRSYGNSTDGMAGYGGV